jgi:hypothetical protein
MSAFLSVLVVFACAAVGFAIPRAQPEPSWFDDPAPGDDLPEALPLAKARWWGNRRFSERYELEFGHRPHVLFNFGYLTDLASSNASAIVDADLDSKYIAGIDPSICRAGKRLVPTIAISENKFEHLFLEHGPLRDP